VTPHSFFARTSRGLPLAKRTRSITPRRRGTRSSASATNTPLCHVVPPWSRASTPNPNVEYRPWSHYIPSPPLRPLRSSYLDRACMHVAITSLANVATKVPQSSRGTTTTAYAVILRVPSLVVVPRSLDQTSSDGWLLTLAH
jgi:hypothetical protein